MKQSTKYSHIANIPAYAIVLGFLIHELCVAPMATIVGLGTVVLLGWLYWKWLNYWMKKETKARQQEGR